MLEKLKNRIGDEMVVREKFFGVAKDFGLRRVCRERLDESMIS